MILITGGSGFIGANLLHSCKACDAAFVVCDHVLPSGRGALIDNDYINSLLFVPADQLFDYLLAPDTPITKVFHLGATSDTRAEAGDALSYNNIIFSQKLWQYCADRGIPFVYASSASTYGSGEKGYDDRQDLAYHQSLEPLNAYGQSKLAVDIWALQQARKGNAPPVWAGLKFFNVYGYGELHKGPQRSVAHQMLEKLPHQKSLRLFQSHKAGIADGEQKRDFVWIEDCVGVMQALSEGKAENGIYNCGSGQARSFRYLAECCFAAHDREGKIEYIPMPEDIRDHYQYFTEAKMDRLWGQNLGIEPTALWDGIVRLEKYMNRRDYR